MTEEELNRVACGFDGDKVQDPRKLPNYGKHTKIDNRDGSAVMKCAFCGSDDIATGFGGYGEGFGYRSAKCRICGGITDFVYKDEVGKYFK